MGKHWTRVAGHDVVSLDCYTEYHHTLKLYDTNLCTWWELESVRQRMNNNKTRNIPKLYDVPVESIDSNVLVVEEEPSVCEAWLGP